MAAGYRVKLQPKRVQPAAEPAGAIAQALLGWFRKGHRDLPWRRTDDPYRIWISEIMLQQTRAQAVIPYYERFLSRFPTVEELAAAAEQDVLAAWSGLGYYSRARNLQRAAQQVLARGEFPRQYEAIRQLPGIGDYTAAAVASIAFRLPYAVVDGNVVRVVARVENDTSDIASARTRERFRAVAQGWLDPSDPGAFNQALMELGATVCLAKKPLCLVCPLTAHCRARAEGTAAELPVKLRRVEPVRLEDRVLVVRRRGRVLLRQRAAQERRMPGFWELPASQHLPGARIGRAIGTFRHTITHHHYTFSVAEASASRPSGAFQWFEPRRLQEIPLSTIARKALRIAGVL
jgi:A/G-specific adenine glycosylase